MAGGCGGCGPPPPDNVPAATASAPIKLAGRSFVRPDLFALASAEAAHWTEARELTLRGAVATWLSVAAVEPRMAADVRRLTGDDGLSDDLRHALALMAMNAALPLTVAGEIVTPAWLLAHAEAGYALITGPAVSHLERMAREPWLVRLGARVAVVQERGPGARSYPRRGSPPLRAAGDLPGQSRRRACAPAPSLPGYGSPRPCRADGAPAPQRRGRDHPGQRRRAPVRARS